MPGGKRPVSVLQLMVQTPCDLFVFWEISREYLALARAEIEGTTAEMVLRLCREEFGQSAEAGAICLGDDALSGSRYFGRQMPRRTYYAELVISFRGGYFTLLRSNRVMTPPSGQETEKSPSVTVQWPAVPPKLPFAYSPEEKMRGD